MEGKWLLIIAACLIYAVIEADTACKDLTPMKGFTPDLIKGKYYWMLMRAPNNGSVVNTCERTYTSIDNKVYTFASIFIDKNGKDAITIMQGIMAPLGRWAVTAIVPKNIPDSTHIALGGKPNNWVLLYSCDKKSGDYTLWVWSRTVMTPVDFLNKNGQELGDVLDANKLPLDEFQSINHDNCKY